MQEIMKMLEELFLNLKGGKTGHWVFGERPDSASENGNPDENDAEREPSILERLGCSVLKNLACEIHMLECVIVALNLKRASLIREHNNLVDELNRLDGKEEPEEPEKTGESNADKPPEHSAPTENPTPAEAPEPHEAAPVQEEQKTPRGNGKRGRPFKREKAMIKKENSYHESLPELVVSGNARLDRLERGLREVIVRLEETKMAFHFKAVKQLRLDLVVLAQSAGKPENERLVELEAGLKHAVDVLSHSPSASNSKVMQQLWGDIIALLKADSGRKQ